MDDILKIVRSLEESGVLLKGVSETIQIEAKEQNGGFLSMLLGTLGASLLGNMLAAIKKVLIPPQPLTNFEIQMYCQNQPRFNGVYYRDNLSEKIKDGAYVFNLDEYSDIGTHWIELYINNKTMTYFDSFGVEHIPKESKDLLIIKTYSKGF